MHINVFDVTEFKVEHTTELIREDNDNNSNCIRRIHVKSDRGPLTITLFNRDYKEDLDLIFPEEKDDA